MKEKETAMAEIKELSSACLFETSHWGRFWHLPAEEARRLSDLQNSLGGLSIEIRNGPEGSVAVGVRLDAEIQTTWRRDVCAAFVRLGYLPPLEIAEVTEPPRSRQGRGRSIEDEAVLMACEQSLSLGAGILNARLERVREWMKKEGGGRSGGAEETTMKKGMAGVIPVQSIYVSDGDRFVVSLTVSYSAEDLEAGGHPVSPRGAVEALRDFIEDGDPPENIYVLDRQAKEAHFEPWEAAEDSSEEEDF